MKHLESDLLDARQENEKLREYCRRLCVELGRISRERTEPVSPAPDAPAGVVEASQVQSVDLQERLDHEAIRSYVANQAALGNSKYLALWLALCERQLALHHPAAASRVSDMKRCPMCGENYSEETDPYHLEACRDARKP